MSHILGVSDFYIELGSVGTAVLGAGALLTGLGVVAKFVIVRPLKRFIRNEMTTVGGAHVAEIAQQALETAQATEVSLDQHVDRFTEHVTQYDQDKADIYRRLGTRPA